MKRILSYLSPVLCLSALLFQACQTDGPENPEPQAELSVSVYKPVIEYSVRIQKVVVQAEGDWTLSLEYKTEDTGWASLSAVSGSGSTEDVTLRCEANGGDERAVDLILSCGSEVDTVTVIQNSRTIEVQHVDIDPADTVSRDVVKLGWMELPEMSSSDPYTFYNHMMTVSGKQTRNYSFYWDSQALVSRWVAYPLNTALIDGKHSREDTWGLDPLLSRSAQPYLCEGGWGVWGYDRGHQIPQADRINITAEGRPANVATYYGTNMTPQNSDLNQNMWACLEGVVRGWSAQVDTLYVVTGCTLDEYGRDFVYDNEGKAVRIPDGYFKALLAYAGATETNRIKWKSAMGDTGYYIAIGFFFENRSYSKSSDYMPYAMTISELEKKTGFNFFSRLEDAVGSETYKKIESSQSSWWKNN